VVNGVTNRFLYDGWNLVSEIRDQMSEVRTNYYVWGLDLSGTLQGAGGIGGLIAAIQDGDVCFPYYDANGNVTELVDTNGTTVAHYEYDPYGNIIAQSGPAATNNPFRFSTKYRDEETGWYYYGYRYYSPELGRWTRRDPLGEDGGCNLFRMLANNALSFFDPLGLDDQSRPDWLDEPVPEPIPGDPYCDCLPWGGGYMDTEVITYTRTVTCKDANGCTYEAVETVKEITEVAKVDGYKQQRRGGPWSVSGRRGAMHHRTLAWAHAGRSNGRVSMMIPYKARDCKLITLLMGFALSGWLVATGANHAETAGVCWYGWVSERILVVLQINGEPERRAKERLLSDISGEVDVLGIHVLDYGVRPLSEWVGLTGKTVVTPTLPRKVEGSGFRSEHLKVLWKGRNLMCTNVFVNLWRRPMEFTEYEEPNLIAWEGALEAEGWCDANVFRAFAVLSGTGPTNLQVIYRDRNVSLLEYGGDVKEDAWARERRRLPSSVSYNGRYPAPVRGGIHSEADIAPCELHPEFDLTYFDSLVKKYPERPSVLMRRVRAYRRIGDDARALRYICEILGKYPDLGIAYVERAAIYRRYGLVRCAQRDLDRAVQLDPKYRQWLEKRGGWGSDVWGHLSTSDN